MSELPVRPQTPQAMLHRLPDKPHILPTETRHSKPSKYIILIVASTAVAGKAQIAKSVADALACPLFQGDSLHETSARAASVGNPAAASARRDADEQRSPAVIEPNKERYQRMWLSKMTRTGYLFPEESRPATEGFSGFGGGSPSLSPTPNIRQGLSISDASASMIASTNSNMNAHMSADEPRGQPGYINNPPPKMTLSEDENRRRTNPALVVVTHPILEQWHKDSVRNVVGDYGIGVIFVPLDQDKELPVLKPLDPRTMTSFASLRSFDDAQKTTRGVSLDDEIVLDVDTELKVEDLIEEVVKGVRDILKI